MTNNTLTYITLNMLHGGEFFENIKAFVKKENPDILCLQEVHNETDPSLPENLRSVQVLQDLLPEFDHYFSAEMLLRKGEQRIVFGNAIFSRFPLTDKQTVFFDLPYREIDATVPGRDYSQDPKNMQLVSFEVNSQRITVANMHGIWGLDGADTDRRLVMSNAIVSHVRDTQPLILSGDFNLKPETTTIKNIEKYLTNVFANELETTFNMRHKSNPGYATAVVDMVFVSPDITVTEKHCPDDDVSDHKPLVVKFQI